MRTKAVSIFLAFSWVAIVAMMTIPVLGAARLESSSEGAPGGPAGAVVP